MPLVRSASSIAHSCGVMASSSPEITSTGQCTPAHRLTSDSRISSGVPSRIPRVVSISVSGVVSSPQPTQSSICLVECGSLNACEKKNSRKPS